MTLISIAEKGGTRIGAVTGSEASESLSWLVKTDSARESMATLYAYGGLPAYLTPHPQNPFATLRKLSYRPVEETADGVGAYLVTGEYSSAPLSQDDRDKAIPNPLDRPAKITVKSKPVMEAYDKDIEGNAIVNTAGDPPDPPLERPVPRWVFTVTKNVASVPLWFLDYEETVNDADFEIKGVTVLEGCAKLSGITISEDMKENNVDFLQLGFEIEVKKAPPSTNVREGKEPENTFEPKGWTTVLLNQGLREKIDEGSGVFSIVNMTDSNGDQLTAPSLLDEDGAKITNPYETAIFLAWETLESKDFSVLPVT